MLLEKPSFNCIAVPTEQRLCFSWFAFSMLISDDSLHHDVLPEAWNGRNAGHLPSVGGRFYTSSRLETEFNLQIKPSAPGCGDREIS